MLTILGKPSSINVRKVLWTCAEIGLPFEQESWGAGFRSTDEPHFRALNPNAMVPVIRDGALVLWESNTICRYLAGKHQRHDLLPPEAGARAMVEQWMDWQAGELNNAWRYAFMALVRLSPSHGDADAVAHSTASWNRHMQILEDQLHKTGAFVTGDTFTLADVVLALSVNRWLMTPIARPDCPAIAAYLERIAQGRAGCALYCRNGTA
jgi:glutathione S-transferase